MLFWLSLTLFALSTQKKRPLVNFPLLRIDLEHILRGRISFCSRWLEGTAKERPSLKCMWAIRGTSVAFSITRLFFLSLSSFFLLAPTLKKTNLKHSISITNVFEKIKLPTKKTGQMNILVLVRLGNVGEKTTITIAESAKWHLIIFLRLINQLTCSWYFCQLSNQLKGFSF